jgi:hypothetical protein
VDDVRERTTWSEAWAETVQEFLTNMRDTIPRAVAMYGKARVLRATAAIAAEQWHYGSVADARSPAAVRAYVSRIADSGKPWDARTPWLAPDCLIEESWIFCYRLASRLVFAPRLKVRAEARRAA